MKIAFLFPGQGSQYVGMAKEFIENFAESREVFEAANDALGFDLAHLCAQGPVEKLNLTENTQPAILASSIAILRPLERRGVSAVVAAGHSLGEYTAITCAGGLAFKDAVALVQKRGRYMQEAVPAGAGLMAAILGMERLDVEKTCLDASKNGIVAPANYNSPGQIVIAGDATAVEVACAQARERGAKRTLPLPVSAPFHCALMAPAAGKLALELARVRFSDARPPIVTNVEAEPNADGERIAELLRAQVTAPVRFVEMVKRMRELGVTKLLEIGPGRVLTGLIGRIDRGLARANLAVLGDLPAAERFVSAGD